VVFVWLFEAAREWDSSQSSGAPAFQQPSSKLYRLATYTSETRTGKDHMTKNTDMNMKAAQAVLDYLRVTFPKRVLTNPEKFDRFMLEATVFMENGPLEVRKFVR